MLGFELDGWDYATFAALALVGGSAVIFVVWLAGLPGRIAIARNHPEAEAVKIMGYAGFLAVVPWIQAFIWAFKPTDVVDIRRFPGVVAAETDKEIARLGGKSPTHSEGAVASKGTAASKQEPASKPSTDENKGA